MASSNRGFAAMDAAKRKEIASKGGKTAHAKGAAHQFSAQEAKAAGMKGGAKVSRDREHMSKIGRRGGQARAVKVKKPKEAPANEVPVSSVPPTGETPVSE